MPCNGSIIRPLLCFTKKEIIDYLQNNNIPFVIDKTNKNNEYFRNRVRNKIMPLIYEENPKFSSNISRMCEIMQHQNDFIEHFAERIDIVVGYDCSTARFSDIKNSHLAVRHAIIKKMAASVGVVDDLTYAMINDVNRLIDSNSTSWSYDIKNCCVLRRYDEFKLVTSKIKHYPDFSYEVKVPSVHIFAESGFCVKIYKTKNVKNLSNKFIKYVDYDTIKNSLVLRNRRENDTFIRCNAKHHVSLKKYFINNKIDRDLRSRIPILTENGNIVCVCGFEIDDRYKITEKTQAILAVEMERYG